MTGVETTVDLSVVVPIHDERDNLQPLVDELDTTLMTGWPAVARTRPLLIVTLDAPFPSTL